MGDYYLPFFTTFGEYFNADENYYTHINHHSTTPCHNR